MKKRFLIPVVFLILSMAISSVCMAENEGAARKSQTASSQDQEGQRTPGIFIKDRKTSSLSQIGGGLSALASDPALTNPPVETEPPVELPAEEETEVFLNVTEYIYGMYEDPLEYEMVPAGYIVKTGDVVHVDSHLDITVLSATPSEITFTTNRGTGIRISGEPQGQSEFTVRKGETLTAGDDHFEDLTFDYDFHYSDVSVKSVPDPGFFTWDIDGDGREEYVEMVFIDQGDEALSGFLVEVTDDEEDWYTWEAFVEGLYEITDLHVFTGAEGNLVIIDGLRGDYYSHDTPYSYAIVFYDDELHVLY